LVKTKWGPGHKIISSENIHEFSESGRYFSENGNFYKRSSLFTRGSVMWVHVPAEPPPLTPNPPLVDLTKQ